MAAKKCDCHTRKLGPKTGYHEHRCECPCGCVNDTLGYKFCGPCNYEQSCLTARSQLG